MTLYTNTTSRIYFMLTSDKKKLFNFESFPLLSGFVYFHSYYAQKGLNKIKKLHLRKCSARDQKTGSSCTRISAMGNIQYLFFRSVFKWLTCCLRSSSLDFDLVRLVFFSNIFPYFRNRPMLEFPSISRHLY